MAPINDELFTEGVDEIEQGIVQRDQADLLSQHEKQPTENTTRTPESEIDNATVPLQQNKAPPARPISEDDDTDEYSSYDLSWLYTYSENVPENNFELQHPYQPHTLTEQDQPKLAQPPQPEPNQPVSATTNPPEFYQQDDSQQGQLHQQPASASKSFYQDKNVVRSHGQWVLFEPENRPYVPNQILNRNDQPNLVQVSPPEQGQIRLFPSDDRSCQPQPDLAKPSTSRTLETIRLEEIIIDPQPQPDNQPDSTHDHQSQPKAQITNQPKSVQRIRYPTEHTHQQVAGQDGGPITLTVTNPTSGSDFWTAIICCIENKTDSLILHSNRLHLMGKMTTKVPLPLVFLFPFVENPENGQLELKLNNVAVHHIPNDQASKCISEVHSQLLKRYKIKSEKPPSLKNYRSPPDFRLLFSIMRNNDLFDSVISDPILDGKPWKIVECVGKKTPIVMTEQKELSVFLSEFPRNNKITASFSYKDEDGNDVVFPEPDDKEIHLKRINQGGGTFITPLFPTPNPSREIKVSL